MSGRESIHNGVVTHPLSEQRANQLYLRLDALNEMLAVLKLANEGVRFQHATYPDLIMKIAYDSAIGIYDATSAALRDFWCRMIRPESLQPSTGLFKITPYGGEYITFYQGGIDLLYYGAIHRWEMRCHSVMPPSQPASNLLNGSFWYDIGTDTLWIYDLPATTWRAH